MTTPDTPEAVREFPANEILSMLSEAVKMLDGFMDQHAPDSFTCHVNGHELHKVQLAFTTLLAMHAELLKSNAALLEAVNRTVNYGEVESVRVDIMCAAAKEGHLHIDLKDEWVQAALESHMSTIRAEVSK